jgi:hypothetical protein
MPEPQQSPHQVKNGVKIALLWRLCAAAWRLATARRSLPRLEVAALAHEFCSTGLRCGAAHDWRRRSRQRVLGARGRVARLDRDEESGKIVGWNGGDSAFSLDLESGVWTALTSPNGPGTANETGTYKRWRYVPGESSFVMVNGPAQNAFLFRL